MKKAQKTIVPKTRNIWTPTIVWALVIFAFSSLSIPSATEFYWKDFVVKKSAHIVEYAILATLLYRSFRMTGFSKIESAKRALLINFFYAVSDEYHQSFTPGRQPKAMDVIFDTIGSAAAIGLIWKYLPKAPKKLKTLAKKYQLI